MIIRCERCSTLYELDESLLSPEGSPVQCTRCQAVFTARPPLGQGRTLAGTPAAAEPAAPAATSTPTATPVPAPAAPADSTSPGRPAAVATATATATASAVGSASPPAPAKPRGARPSPAVYRPPAPAAAAAAASRPPAVRRDTVGAFEARLKASHLWKRLAIPLAAAVLVAALAGAWALWRRRPDPEVGRLRVEAAALLAQDDAASLARAVERSDAALAREPGQLGALADRALARILAAAARLEELEPLADRLAAASGELARLQREQPPGVEEAEQAATAEVARLEAELAPRRQEAEALARQGRAELEALARAPSGEAVAARGLVVSFALAGEADQVARYAGVARAAGPDPWADLAETWLELQQGPPARDQAIKRLQALVTAHPELIRARFLLARAQSAAGRREEAEATLAGLLAANPRHERAQRMRGRLAEPPAAAPPTAAPAAAAPSVPQRPAEWRRPAPAAAPPPAAPAAAPLAPAAAPVATPEPEPEPAPAQAVPPAPEPVAPVPAPPPARRSPEPAPQEPPQDWGG